METLRSQGRIRHRSAGLSLIELMVIVVLLGIGLVGVSTMFISGVISDTKAERISRASNAAQRELERLRSAGYSGCQVDTAVFPPDDGYIILEQESDLTGAVRFPIEGLPGGTGTIVIDRYSDAIGTWPNLKEVTITATWGGGRRTQGSVHMATLIGNRPD